MARPTSVRSSPPGMRWACTANTGRIRNRPSMRRAKIAARLAPARRSSEVILSGSGALMRLDKVSGKGAILTATPGKRVCPGNGFSRIVACYSHRADAMDEIRIRGARTHNLRNVSLDLPRNRLTVITGLSGSGKSSLAFDTLYAEGQRRYVESLSAYARQFLQLMEKPDVDLIEGLSPAISIEQKATSHNPRSTVGTVTEIHD